MLSIELPRPSDETELETRVWLAEKSETTGEAGAEALAAHGEGSGSKASTSASRVDGLCIVVGTAVGWRMKSQAA